MGMILWIMIAVWHRPAVAGVGHVRVSVPSHQPMRLDAR